MRAQKITEKKEPKKWNDIDFVAYEVIEPQLKPSAQMKWLKKNKIILMVTHKLANIKYYDRIIFIDDEQNTHVGTHAHAPCA